MESANRNISSDLNIVRKIRKNARYQLDDFAVVGTPPTLGDGLLFSNIGHRSVERTESTYDRINRELSGQEKPALINSIARDNIPDNFSASLSVGLSGICLTPLKEDLTNSDQNFIIPSGDEISAHRLSISEASSPEPRSRKVSHYDTKNVNQEALLEVFNELKALREENSDTLSAPILPLTETLPSSYNRQRKFSAPPSLAPSYVMDSNKSSNLANFFFNGGLTSFCSKITNTNNTEIIENSTPVISTDMKVALPNSVDTSSTTSPLSTPPTLSPTIKKKKLKRPTKSALREMNLWVPQSM